MRLIDRYQLRQLLGPTLLATAALTAVALLSQSLSGLDLIVNQRQSAIVFLKITLLYMPQLINMILPIAVLVAALVALNRLHTEQEIVVCFAGGMSRWRVISPAMRLAGTIAFLALAMNLWVQPLAYRALREVLFEVRTDLAATLVREGEFTEPVPGLTVYAQSIDSKGEMHNLFINQMKGDGSAITYTANTGHIATRNGQPVLLLKDEATQQFSPRGVLEYLTNSEYPFELNQLNSADEMGPGTTSKTCGVPKSVLTDHAPPALVSLRTVPYSQSPTSRFPDASTAIPHGGKNQPKLALAPTPSAWPLMPFVPAMVVTVPSGAAARTVCESQK